MSRSPKTRYERQVSRRRFEEIAAWIVLPILILLCWWIGVQVYNAWDVPASVFLPTR